MTINTGDKLTMKKRHPCGSVVMTVTRVGADIGIRCDGCGRTLMLPRHELEKKIRSVTGTGEHENDGKA